MKLKPKTNGPIMHPLALRPVTKMNGLGNEIVILDLRGTSCDIDAEAARAIGRGDVLAFDQLMVLRDPRSSGTDAYVQILNSDGSEAEACGNGMRCVVWSLLRGTKRPALRLETMAGVFECRRQGERSFAVDMGRPRFSWRDIPLAAPVADTAAIPFSFDRGDTPMLATAVNMGNPHAVFFVENLDAYDLASIGPELEHHSLFPERANISLAHIVDRGHIQVRVWERGVGLTRACGSAACAVLVGAAQKNLANREAEVSLPGGDLTVAWRESDDHVVLTGPVELEFETTLDPLLFEGAAA
jgi:diaminopimelate epimerase